MRRSAAAFSLSADSCDSFSSFARASLFWFARLLAASAP